MSYAMEQLTNLINDETPRVIHESLPELAPYYSQIKKTSQEVVRDDGGIGPAWKVKHTFNVGVAGLMTYANPLGPGMTTITGNQVGLFALGDAAADMAPFPIAARSPHSADIQRTLYLHMATGNFSIPIVWLQADRLSATVIKKVGREIKAVGQYHALMEAVGFHAYSASDGTYPVRVLGRLAGTPVEVGVTDYFTVTVDEKYGTIHNFRPGMTIDIVNTSTDTIQTGAAIDGSDVMNYTHTGQVYVQLVIVSVDYFNKAFVVCPVNTTTGGKPNFGWATNADCFQAAHPPAINDWIVVAGCSRSILSRPFMSWGLEDWCKASGRIMGGASAEACLDLDTYTQFRSQVQSISGPLTEGVMNRVVGGFMNAYPGASIDTLITTLGVTLKWLEQPTLYNSRLDYNRTDKAQSMIGGWERVGFLFNGRNLQWMIDPMCLKSRMYGQKFAGGNVKRYIPPRIGGTDAEVGSEVEFLGPIAGHTGNLMGAVDATGAPQAYVQAPFWQYFLLAPEDVRGVKMTDITESVLVS